MLGGALYYPHDGKAREVGREEGREAGSIIGVGLVMMTTAMMTMRGEGVCVKYKNYRLGPARPGFCPGAAGGGEARGEGEGGAGKTGGADVSQACVLCITRCVGRMFPS